MIVQEPQDRKIKFYFIWHWNKKTTKELRGAFAAFDSLIFAIAKLTELKGYEIKILTIDSKNKGDLYSKNQGIYYKFFDSKSEIIDYLKKENPHYIFLNHHSRSYKDFVNEIVNLSAKKIIFYSAAIVYKNPFRQYITDQHLKFDYHIVHHQYQKDQLVRKFKINPTNIIIAPKTANFDLFKPLNLEKKWDCIYPARGGEGYLKRLELAIKACKIANKTLCLPGAVLKGKYEWVTTFDEWQSPEALAKLYNQSRCLLMTTNYLEMGPRVTMEAAACNIPIICCSDSLANVSHVSKIGGFIAKPNPKDIAEKIELAINTKIDSRSELKRIGFTYDLLYKKILEIINKFD